MYITEIKAYDYIALKQTLLSLSKKYPLLNISYIGKSCAGRDIPAVKIGKSQEYALIAAAFHGTEYITETVLLRFIESLCKALQNDESIAGFNARKAMFGRGVIFVPCVNPDGCEIVLHGSSAAGFMAENVLRIAGGNLKKWNANLRGVDINHNFDADWEKLRKMECEAGITGPALTRFGGFRAESEPETLALTTLCRTKRIRHVAALHSQGQEIYWKYGDYEPARSRKMAEIMATTSGYMLSEPKGLAVGGGFKDWFIKEFNRPGFTVEMGKGENPLPIETAKEIYERLEEMLMLTVIM
ncbi:MAG: gamma-D-glutamyl-meso-diaminopimelate peptidase [Ruminococcaceae bacterium]|nr:gamma-D-glutamyl-meso-diaminopimelate peptidase [Oscillospiraceae bacterium]